MDDLILSINKIHDVNNKYGAGVELPTHPEIIVIGEQSAGKSSVLESLVKQPILPRGEGMVTRCPIVLQLNYVAKDNNDPIDEMARPEADEWCTLLHKPGEIFTDFSDVTVEIFKQTNYIAGKGKDISNDAIVVKVFSHRVLTLTVVDLPGFVKNPTDDQPEDIEEQINCLVEAYANYNEKSIILAVTAATQDIAASESLKLAKKWDPEGRRTVVVITKLDMVESGSAAVKDLLAGKKIKSGRGIYGVVNRNLKESKDGMSIEEKLVSEERFLQQNYPKLAHQNGSKHLGLRLQEILKEEIVKWLPKMRSQVQAAVIETEAQLYKCGVAPTDKPKTMRSLLTEFGETLDSAIVGQNRRIDRTTSLGGEKIREILTLKLRKMMDEIDPNCMEDDEIRIFLGNAAGMGWTFNPDHTFQELVKDKIKELEGPAVACFELASDGMRTVVDNCFKVMGQKMACYPKLKQAIERELDLELDKYCEKAVEQLKGYVQIEASYIHTADEKFKEEMRSLVQKGSTSSSGSSSLDSYGRPLAVSGQIKPSSSLDLLSTGMEDSLTERLKAYSMIKRLVASYFEHMKRTFENHCPKIFMCFVVNNLQGNVKDLLIEKFSSDEDKVEELIVEDETVVQERELAARRLKALLQTKKILSELRRKRIPGSK